MHGLSYGNLVKANLKISHYIVITEEMYEFAVNDNAEDFPKVAVDAYRRGSYWRQLCLHFCGLG